MVRQVTDLFAAEPPTYCWSRQDILKKRNSWISVIILALSIYSTVMSAIWMVVAFVQPRWGHKISSRGGVIPSTATLVTALVAKTIELSFVTVFISCVGQVLTRRAIARRSTGVTLAEMTMRNWVIQPGYLITHFETIPYAGLTVLGALSLTATIAAMFYTTASDAMVAPKLKFGSWETVQMQGRVRSSYANAVYVKELCPSLFDPATDISAQESCLNVEFSGQSFRNLLSFMTDWTAISNNGTSRAATVGQRPVGTTLLYDNTTMSSSWIQTEHSNVTAQWVKYGRIVNNVTLAMPHPGVYTAAQDPINGILQPDDLAGVGEYAIRAGVVSPALNVMCVNMDKDELKPLVYVSWPTAKTSRLLDVGEQDIGYKLWETEVPPWYNQDGQIDYLNRTAVDDIFGWGPKYSRIPPVFQAVSSARRRHHCWLMLTYRGSIQATTTPSSTGQVPRARWRSTFLPRARPWPTIRSARCVRLYPRRVRPTSTSQGRPVPACRRTARTSMIPTHITLRRSKTPASKATGRLGPLTGRYVFRRLFLPNKPG